MSQATLLVFGEALADVFPTRTVLGGAPFNVARHLTQLGCRAHLMSRLANDKLGKLVVAECANFGIGLSTTDTDSPLPTGVVQVGIQADGSHQFTIARPSAWDEILPLPASILGALKVNAVVYGTLALRSEFNRKTLKSLISECRTAQNPRPLLVCDFNWREGHLSLQEAWAATQEADCLKLSIEEWTLLAAHLHMDEAEPEALLERYGFSMLILTRGTAGYTCFQKGGPTLSGPAVLTEHFADSVGAGDSFLALTLAAHLQGMNLNRALTLAAEFASAICGVHGAVPTTLEFYEPFKREIQKHSKT